MLLQRELQTSAGYYSKLNNKCGKRTFRKLKENSRKQFCVLKKTKMLFLAVWSWGSSGKPLTRPETQTLLFVLTNQVWAASGCLQVNKAGNRKSRRDFPNLTIKTVFTIMWCKYHTARFLLQIGSKIRFLWVSVKGQWWSSPSWLGRFSSLQMFTATKSETPTSERRVVTRAFSLRTRLFPRFCRRGRRGPSSLGDPCLVFPSLHCSQISRRVKRSEAAALL